MVTLSSIRLGVERQQETVGLDSAEVLSIAGSGVSVYDTLDSLPMTGLSAGDEAFVKGNSRLYVSNGSGWYNISLVNRTPRWDSGGEPDASYEIADSATPLVITARAIDSDNATLLNQSSASDSAAFMATISYDSSVFTFTPKSADSIGASVAAGDLTDSNGDFVYTFKWSDGINFVSKAVTITYNVVAAGALISWGGTRGFFIGGNESTRDDTIQYFDITTPGNTTDFGNLTGISAGGTSASNKSRIVYRKGVSSGAGWSAAYSTDIDYFASATTGNASDFGNSTVYVSRLSSVSNGTRGIFAGGYGGATTSDTWSQAGPNVVEYVTIANTGNATDFGDLSSGRNGLGATNDETRGVFAGGYDGDGSNVMEYITMDTASNSTDFGDVLNLMLFYTNNGVVSDNTTGCFSGGYEERTDYVKTDVIQKITIQTTGNATDFGDLSQGGIFGQQCSDGTTGVIAPGNGVTSDGRIDKITIGTPSNATDFGDMLGNNRRYESAGVSGNAA